MTCSACPIFPGHIIHMFFGDRLPLHMLTLMAAILSGILLGFVFFHFWHRYILKRLPAQKGQKILTFFILSVPLYALFFVTLQIIQKLLIPITSAMSCVPCYRPPLIELWIKPFFTLVIGFIGYVVFLCTFLVITKIYHMVPRT